MRADTTGVVVGATEIPTAHPEDDMTTEPIADCECCDTPLHEGDDFEFCPEGLVWVCRACVEAEEDRLREEFGWIGVWKGTSAGGVTGIPDIGGSGP